MLSIREARPEDLDAVWAILEPVIRAGETYTLARDLSREKALAWWFSDGHEVFVAIHQEQVAGTYMLRPNQAGGGSHVANCGYITASFATGNGVARAMCAHSLDHARKRNYRAMQFNFVVSSNDRAVRLWKSFGFEIVGRLPDAFAHPTLGYTDAYVMYRFL
jgi:ribosomal protein S18 acetylase RimI-like enzyme